jgi:hypothetical protein
VRFTFAHHFFSQHIAIRLIQVFERTSSERVLHVHFPAPAYRYHYAATTKVCQPKFCHLPLRRSDCLDRIFATQISKSSWNSQAQVTTSTVGSCRGLVYERLFITAIETTSNPPKTCHYAFHKYMLELRGCGSSGVYCRVIRFHTR